MTTRQVTGTYQTPNGIPQSGSISFELPAIADDGSLIYSQQPVIVNLDASGHFTVSLVTTDTLDILGITYRVTERLVGQAPNRFYMLLPTSGSPLDLTTVTRLTDLPTLYAPTDPSVWATDAEVAADIAVHNADTTAVHGITDTSALALSADVVAKGSLFFNVKDYGAVGDGVADDTAAIQAAINAAGQGNRVYLPYGSYKCTSGLTMLAGQTLEGSSPYIGAGTSGPVELNFSTLTGSATALTVGASGTLRSLTVTGPQATVGTVTGIAGATFRADHVTVRYFYTGMAVTAGYYNTFTNCEWSRNATGLLTSGCYNMTLVAPKFMAAYGVADATLGTAINASARGLNIFGGSIESFTTGINMADASRVSLFGTYIETGLTASATVVYAWGRSGVTVTMLGCMVYLNGCNYFVRMDTATNSALTSLGNHFVCVSGSSTAPTIYTLAGGAQVALVDGDNMTEVVKAGVTYATATGGLAAATGARVNFPPNSGTASGTVFDGRRVYLSTAPQTISVNGAVTIDASVPMAEITLQANATSSTVTNLYGNQELTIAWIQDATGGRTYSWPPICRFAGGAAPSDTTANARTTVRFRYNGSTGRLNEIYRSVAVPA